VLGSKGPQGKDTSILSQLLLPAPVLMSISPVVNISTNSATPNILITYTKGRRFNFLMKMYSNLRKTCLMESKLRHADT
jgi:hypothetical protein